MKSFIAAGIAVSALVCVASNSQAQNFNPHPLWEYTETSLLQAPEQPVIRVKSYGPTGSPSTASGNGSSDSLEFGESERGSLGCLVGGAAGTAGALLVGGENIINLIAGGLVVPSSPAALYASLFGVVFASFCAVGQAMTPAVIYAYRRYFEDGEYALPMSAPTAPREPAILGRHQKTVYDPNGADRAFYVR